MRRAAKSATKVAGVVSTMSIVAMAGGPAAVGLAAMAAVLLTAFCWVLNDAGRSLRLVQVICAVRGTPGPGERDQPAVGSGRGA